MRALAILLIMALPGTSFAAGSVSGAWQLMARKCATAKRWEKLPGTTSILNAETNSYEVEMVGASCVLRKIGTLKVTASTIELCGVKANASGPGCSQAVLEHVRLVNSNQSSETCSSRSYSISQDGQELMMSESTEREGFNCPVGVDVQYMLKRLD